MQGNIVVEISENAMEAYVTIDATGAAEVTEERIRSALASAGVVYGIKDRVASELPHIGQRGMKYIAAQGSKPERGVNGCYEFLVENDSPVTKGMHLANYYPAQAGILGSTVLGTTIAPAPSVDEPELDLMNVDNQVNEFYATEDGILKQRGYILKVFRKVEMDGVTLAHGPLEVAGDLIVHGDIGDGAVLSVAGNLVVEGMVEGASLTVGNHLVAKQGIRGKGKAVICAERLSTTFMEETKAEVEQQILANFIFNCDVDCKGSVVCKGTKGQIIGGCIKACTYVEAMTTGKETGLGARFVLKDADLSEPVDKYVMVHGDMLGNTTIEIDDRISNNLTGSNVEFHYSNDGIKSYTIGSYVKPEELVQDETSRLIVLVDDDPVVLKQEYSDLADTYMVAAITKPTDALAFVAKKKPDLLLLDYMMPELNGVELLEKIRKLPGCAGIPAFFLTGVTDRAVVAKCLSVYPQGYLLKPMNRESLLKTLGDYFDENP